MFLDMFFASYKNAFETKVQPPSPSSDFRTLQTAQRCFVPGAMQCSNAGVGQKCDGSRDAQTPRWVGDSNCDDAKISC